jgi:GT2 family glycosyltransferase
LSEEIVVIVCTRNRSANIARLMRQLHSRFREIDALVIVDSSDNQETRKIVLEEKRGSLVRVEYLKSEYGLPHQRNAGLQLIESSYASKHTIISFLDDDVLPTYEYFSNLRRLFTSHQEVDCLGGFDTNIAPAHNSKLRRMAGLAAENTERAWVLDSGIALHASPKSDLIYCDWVPGGMQSYRASAIQGKRFDGRIRMFGEDVEFQMRCFGRPNQIATSCTLGVDHSSDQSGKSNHTQSALYSDGFRWRLSKDHPDRVKGHKVLMTTVILAFGEIVTGLLMARTASAQRGLGHILFLYRLVRRREFLELVMHGGSGPFVGPESRPN